MTDTVDLAARIRDLMDDKRVTQAALAKALQMQQPAIARALNGRSNPRVATLQKILRYLEGGSTLEYVASPRSTQGVLRPVNLGGKPKEVSWLVNDLVARGYVTVLAGMEGAGKSLFCQNVAAAIAMGKRDAADMPVQTGHVLYLDAENGRNEILRRFQALGVKGAGGHRMHIVEAEGGFDMEHDVAKLRAAIQQAKCDLLILDSWTTLWSGRVGFPEHARRCLNLLRDLAREFDMGVLLIHHTDKTGKTYIGSQAVGATVEALFLFTRLPNPTPADVTLRFLHAHKMRIGPEPPTRMFQLAGSAILPRPLEL